MRVVARQPVRSVGGPRDGYLRRACRVDIRLCFVLDLVGFGRRPGPDRADLQQRLRGVVVEVLSDVVTGDGSVDWQGTGDGIIVLLPERVQFQRVLPFLLHSMARRLAVDNRRHTDRMRLRMATGIGPIGRGAVGFTGSTVLEVCRLVDCEPLRRALEAHPAADLAVLVSDVLYGWVVGEGHPGLDAAGLQAVDVTVKDFQAPAWLWTPGAHPQAQSEVARTL